MIFLRINLRNFSYLARWGIPVWSDSMISSASEVTTLWRYTNLFIIIIIIFTRPEKCMAYRPTSSPGGRFIHA